MKIEEIVELKKLTKNKDILRKFLTLDSDLLSRTLAYYKNLINKYKISEKVAEEIMIHYIDSFSSPNYTLVEALILFEKFLEKLSNMPYYKFEQIYQELEKVDNTQNPSDCTIKKDILLNDNVLEKYDSDDYANLLYEINQYGTSCIVLSIIFDLTNYGHSIDNIHQILTIITNVLDEKVKIEIPNRDFLLDILKPSSFVFDLDGDKLIQIINSIIQAKNTKELNLIKKIMLTPFALWQDGRTVDQVFAIIKYICENDYEDFNIFNKFNLFQYRSIEEIKEILDYCNEYPDNSAYYLNSNLLIYTTWQEQLDLFDNYELANKDNLSRFYDMLNDIVKNKKGTTNITAVLRNQLEAKYYETTVEDFLNLCSSIEEFTNKLLNTYDRNYNLELKSTIKIQK